MSSKPTLVFVPGAWHSADTWNKVVPIMEAKGHKCLLVPLPSTLSDPNTTFLEDIQAVREPLIAETKEGRDVVLVVHSYGGQVGNSSIKGLTKPEEATAGDSSGHVLGIALIASGFTAEGLGSFMDAFGGKPPPEWRPDSEGFTEIIVDARELFYHDLPKEEGEYWVGRLLKHAWKVLAEGGEHAYSGWKHVPTWYLSTTEDKALPVQAQQFFVQTARDQGGDVTVREIDSSHSPMLSRAEETAEFLADAAEAFQK